MDLLDRDLAALAVEHRRAYWLGRYRAKLEENSSSHFVALRTAMVSAKHRNDSRLSNIAKHIGLRSRAVYAVFDRRVCHNVVPRVSGGFSLLRLRACWSRVADDRSCAIDSGDVRYISTIEFGSKLLLTADAVGEDLVGLELVTCTLRFQSVVDLHQLQRDDSHACRCHPWSLLRYRWIQLGSDQGRATFQFPMVG